MKKDLGLLFIADVDGVFTDKKAVPNAEAILLSAEVGVQYPFAYVTGRSARWLQENMLPVLERAYREYTPQLSLLCAEYGAVRLRFIQGSWRKEKDEGSLDALRAVVAERISQIDGVFFDDTKEVMVSVEARHDLRDTQPEVVEQGLDEASRYLKGLAEESPDEREYHETTYARDLTLAGLNKVYGARKVMEHVDFHPGHVHLLGDARSDFLLTEPFWEQSWPFTFHFVGEGRFSMEEWEAYHIESSNAHYPSSS